MEVNDKNYVEFCENMHDISSAIFDLRQALINLYLIQGDESAIYELEAMLSEMKSHVSILSIDLEDKKK